jgi:hypothetical protein
MGYSNRDTDWDLSAQGNYWRRINGRVPVVGAKHGEWYWAMVDGKFAPKYVSDHRRGARGGGGFVSGTRRLIPGFNINATALLGASYVFVLTPYGSDSRSERGWTSHRLGMPENEAWKLAPINQGGPGGLLLPMIDLSEVNNV